MGFLRTFLVACPMLLQLMPDHRVRPTTAPGATSVYFGTYTRAESKGIYVASFDPATGLLGNPVLAAETPNPSFLAIPRDGRFLYAVSEISGFEGRKSGAVSAFAIDPSSGYLTLLNSVPSGGDGPCYVALDRSEKHVLVANYGGGSVAVLPVHADGRLDGASVVVRHTGSSVNPQRQQGPHAHSIQPSPDNRFAVAADLGLDQLLVYRFDPSKGSLAPNDPPHAALTPGAGPRHFAFHPGGRRLYVINELQSTVSAFEFDAVRGRVSEIQTCSTLPSDFSGENSTAEVLVHPSGRFLYGSNRGHDSIAVFAIDPDSGVLSPVEHVSSGGRTPRNFGIDPTGSWLLAANQNSGTVVVYRIDRDSGRLTPTGRILQVPSPVCVTFAGYR